MPDNHKGDPFMKRFLVPALLVVTGIAATNALTKTPRAEAAQKEHKVAICHGTASEKNPYVLIIVDESAKDTHLAGHGKNSAPDYALNGGRVLTPAEENSLKEIKNAACGVCPDPDPSSS
jgi:hypothetical protein